MLEATFEYWAGLCCWIWSNWLRKLAAGEILDVLSRNMTGEGATLRSEVPGEGVGGSWIKLMGKPVFGLTVTLALVQFPRHRYLIQSMKIRPTDCCLRQNDVGSSLTCLRERRLERGRSM